MPDDRTVLRGLAKRVLEIAQKPVQEERRRLWRRQNSFLNDRPLIYVRQFAFCNEICEEKELLCGDPLLRQYEHFFRELLFRDTLNDDTIAEPWVILPAVTDPPIERRWGVELRLSELTEKGGSRAYQPILLNEEDFHKLRPTRHRVDEALTARRYEKLAGVIGDILPVEVNRMPLFDVFQVDDISTQLGYMRGLEQLMWDAYDRPEWLHRLLGFMRDSLLAEHEEAERAGDLSLFNSKNQAMAYSMELPDPAAGSYGQPRSNLWGYMAAQEFTGFSPEMFEEFILRYQIPVAERFGLSAYGCCEDLTGKIPYLRRIENLRRIAVSPYSDPEKCARQIGPDYIASWRPNPSMMLAMGLDEAFVRGYLRRHFEIFRRHRTPFDITLKDVETVHHEPQNVARWVAVVREEIESFF